MIKADVHQVDDGVTNPVIVWIHGAALITGGRESVPAWFRDWTLAERTQHLSPPQSGSHDR
jgi:hypothetical protein